MSFLNAEIVKISEQLITLLKDNNEDYWSVILQNILCNYIDSAGKEKSANQFIFIMRGGMGSFLDLVLHKDRKPLVDENNKLDELRHQLYEECKKHI